MFSSVARSCSPILCKARGSERGRQLGSLRLAAVRPGRGSYLPPWPRRVPGSSAWRPPLNPSRLSREQLRASSRSCVVLVLVFFCCVFGFVFFFSSRPPRRGACALSQAGGRLPVLSAGLKPTWSRSCPRPRWRPRRGPSPPRRPPERPRAGGAAGWAPGSGAAASGDENGTGLAQEGRAEGACGERRESRRCWHG